MQYRKYGYPESKNTRRRIVPEMLKIAATAIPFERLGAYLPFQTRTVAGYNHNHIMSLSGFDVVTENRIIEEGDTFCGRISNVYFNGPADSNCPGCEAIAQGLVIREIENA